MLRRRRRTPVSPVFVLLVLITIAGGALSTADSQLLITIGVMLLVLGGWTVSLCLHEFGHAAVAYRGGDLSVENRGYLTLDVRNYFNPGLSLVLPAFFLLAGGIPLPGGAVWINESALRSKQVRSMVSLAGPLINLVLGILLVAAIRSIDLPYGLLIGLSYLALVQVLAFVLNILPVPGLDGFGIWEPYLSPRTQLSVAKIKPWAPLIFFLLLVTLPALSGIFFSAAAAIFSGIGGSADAAALGYDAFTPWRR